MTQCLLYLQKWENSGSEGPLHKARILMGNRLFYLRGGTRVGMCVLSQARSYKHRQLLKHKESLAALVGPFSLFWWLRWTTRGQGNHCPADWQQNVNVRLSMDRKYVKRQRFTQRVQPSDGNLNRTVSDTQSDTWAQTFNRDVTRLFQALPPILLRASRLKPSYSCRWARWHSSSILQRSDPNVTENIANNHGDL